MQILRRFLCVMYHGGHDCEFKADYAWLTYWVCRRCGWKREA